MKQFQTVATAAILYAVFWLSIDSQFAADFRQYLVENY